MPMTDKETRRLIGEKETRERVKRLNAVIAKVLAGMKPPDDLTVTEWAEKNRRLSTEASAEPGPWRTDRTPYLREPMDAFTDPRVRRIVMVAALIVQVTSLAVCVPSAHLYRPLGVKVAV